ncbi:MAG: RDD family protein, partial [Actinomycetes bacterium]
MTDLVTGEAVVLELRLAKLASRALALTIDLSMQMVALFGFIVLMGSLSSVLDTAALAATTLTGSVAILIGYPVTMEALSRGRTVGKIALGLRVVRDDGGPIRFRHALIRGLAQLVDFYLLLGAVALVSSLASSRGKRVGDALAGTVVVRERVPVRGGPVAQMPPPLAAWAQGLQLSGLPDDLALAVRHFLSRTRELQPRARYEMGVRLADAVALRVSPAPPPGTPPEAYLAAVLAERRAREAHRLAGHPPVGAYGGPGPYGGAGPSGGPG